MLDRTDKLRMKSKKRAHLSFEMRSHFSKDSFLGFHQGKTATKEEEAKVVRKMARNKVLTELFHLINDRWTRRSTMSIHQTQDLPNGLSRYNSGTSCLSCLPRYRSVRISYICSRVLQLSTENLGF